MPLCGVPEHAEHPQSMTGPAFSDAEPRPPCACGVGVGFCANRLIREGFGVEPVPPYCCIVKLGTR